MSKVLLIVDGWELCCTGGTDSFAFHFDQLVRYLAVDPLNKYILRDVDACIHGVKRIGSTEVVEWDNQPGWSIWKRPKITREEKIVHNSVILEAKVSEICSIVLQRLNSEFNRLYLLDYSKEEKEVIQKLVLKRISDTCQL